MPNSVCGRNNQLRRNSLEEIREKVRWRLTWGQIMKNQVAHGENL
jgi:hypothetical protein